MAGATDAAHRSDRRRCSRRATSGAASPTASIDGTRRRPPELGSACRSGAASRHSRASPRSAWRSCSRVRASRHPPIVVVLAATDAAASGTGAAAPIVASISGDGTTLVTRPIAPVALRADRSLELWAVPTHGAAALARRAAGRRRRRRAARQGARRTSTRSPSRSSRSVARPPARRPGRSSTPASSASLYGVDAAPPRARADRSCDVDQAARVAEAAVAVEARHAVEPQLVLQPEDARALVERRRVQRAGRAEHRDLRARRTRRRRASGPSRCSRGRATRRSAPLRRAATSRPARTQARAAGVRRDLLAQRALRRASRAGRRVRRRRMQRARERGVMLRAASAWPGRIRRRARRSSSAPRASRAAERAHRVARSIEVQLRPARRIERRAGEGAVERHHRRPAGRIRPGVRLSSSDRALAAIADALRDARQPRHERRLERVRQHVGDVEAAAQPRGDAAARGPVEPAVRERQLDRLGDLGHRANTGATHGNAATVRPLAALRRASRAAARPSPRRRSTAGR